MANKNNIRLSKYLCLILRHKPDIIGIDLDEHGWADVTQLLEKMNQSGETIDLHKLDEVVRNDNKKRFSFNDTLDKIRANQGHSINIDLGYKAQRPPEYLYHGTAGRFAESILRNGIEKKKRHHVHLSPDEETAIKVGRRHGDPVVFKIAAGQMHGDGALFYLSNNGIWLTDYVAVKYLCVQNHKK
ncbi:MAG TPA: RNA 2'-phosphotransferase [Ignavibacteriaceae bacterium]|nr:RNA 2'-phosphotransferase [Ignavibacteriaceae bacterium]